MYYISRQVLFDTLESLERHEEGGSEVFENLKEYQTKI